MKTSNLMDWALDLLREIEHSPNKRAWCQQYSVYGQISGQEVLLQNLYAFSDRVYEAGMVIANYKEVIDFWNLDEHCIMQSDSEWLAYQPYLCVLASIAWHFRRDHFCEGSLISQSIASGAMLRLFQRLKDLCPTAAPAVTLRELCCNGCKSIPEEPGIYWILSPEGMPILFREQPYHSKSRLYPVPKLYKKFEGCTEHRTLYIGKAAGKHGLRQRLKQYIDYGQGKGNVHRGGRAIWQIEHSGLLLLAYEICEHPEVREHQLLLEYQKKNGTYPLANWRG